MAEHVTVYVDNMKAKFRGMIVCHMIADTEAELHEMAAKIGVARKWYQDDHYDISMTKKAEARANGAVRITWDQAAAMMSNVRSGWPMGTPETCEGVAALRRQIWSYQLSKMNDDDVPF